MSIDDDGDKAIEQWKIKKLIQKLEQARGFDVYLLPKSSDSEKGMVPA